MGNALPRSADQLLTISEVQDRTRLSRTMVYRLISSGDLASVRVGRSRRVPESALADFIDRLVSQ